MAVDPYAEYGPTHAQTCAAFGHAWRHLGGKACDCEFDDGVGCCSVPVHECATCGDCDYGDNEWAAKTREECKERRERC